MSDYDEVMAVENRWVDAHRNLSPDTLEDILDDAYLRIEGDRVVGKVEVINSYRSGRRHWDVAEASDYTVQVFDDTAIVVGTWRGVGVNHDEAFDYSTRFLSIYIRRPNGWKMIRDEDLGFGR